MLSEAPKQRRTFGRVGSYPLRQIVDFPDPCFALLQDVFEVISPAAVRKLKAERLGNVEALLRRAVLHLEKVRQTVDTNVPLFHFG